MTKRQRRAIEILNDLKDNRYDDDTPVIDEDEYFLLLSFVTDCRCSQNEVKLTNTQII